MIIPHYEAWIRHHCRVLGHFSTQPATPAILFICDLKRLLSMKNYIPKELNDAVEKKVGNLHSWVLGSPCREYDGIGIAALLQEHSLTSG